MRVSSTIIRLAFCVAVIFAGSCVHSQTIQYSRQTLISPIYDRLQLVPSVGNHNHLLFFQLNTSLTIYNFSKDLVGLGQKTYPIRLSANTDLRIIPFKSHYLLYLHAKGSTTHELWKVDSNGDVYPLSKELKSFIDSSAGSRTTTLQLVNRDEELSVIQHVYFPQVRSLVITLSDVDPSMNKLRSSQFTIPFVRGQNQLNQVNLIGQSLYILQSVRHDEGYEMEFIRAELSTGKMFRKSFSSSDNFIREAHFRFMTPDSGFLLQSAAGSLVFISRLDARLNEQAPPKLFKPPLQDDGAASFVLLEGTSQQWLAFTTPPQRNNRGNRSNNTDPVRAPTSYEPTDPLRLDTYRMQLYRSNANGFGTYTPYSTNITTSEPELPGPIRISLLDTSLTVMDEELIRNEKYRHTVSPAQFTSFTIDSNAYLILKRDLGRKKKGLLLLSSSSSNEVEKKDITVFEKYEYLLQNAQVAAKGIVLMPYLDKFEIGLVRLDFTKQP